MGLHMHLMDVDILLSEKPVHSCVARGVRKQNSILFIRSESAGARHFFGLVKRRLRVFKNRQQVAYVKFRHDKKSFERMSPGRRGFEKRAKINH
jgi:hypothetical protein